MLKRLVNCNLWLILILSFLIIGQAFGQNDFNLTALTTKNGLSSNTINAILQDHTGVVWFGTGDGLNKFDGTNVTVYNHDERDSTTVPANEILSLIEDGTGRLWVGTRGGLAYYDRQHDTFFNYKGDIFMQKRPSIIKSLYRDRSGKIWIGSFGGFRVLDPVTMKVSRFDISHLLHALNAVAVLAFCEDKHNQMWIGTSGGALLLKNKKFIPYVHNDADNTSISNNSISAITKDKNGNLFFGTSAGLNLLMPDEKSFRVFKHSDSEPYTINNDIIYSAVVGPQGKLWLGTEGGLSIFDVNHFTSVNIKPDKRKSFSLSDKSVHGICMADRGIIWLGTYQGGVNKYDPNLALFNLIHSAPYDPKGLPSPIVTSFAEYQNNQVFIGTDGGGLNLLNRNTGLFTHCDIKSKIDHSGNPVSIMAMELDAQKKLWVGTYQNGLFVYEPSTGSYKQYLAGPGEHELSNNEVFFVKQDSKGLIWIGTNGGGVNVFDPKTQTFLKFNNHPQNNGMLRFASNGFMRACAEDKAGNIWLGSHGSGIAVYRPGSNDFILYNKSNSKLTDDVVLNLFRDKDDNIWVGTNGGGINIFNKATQQFTHLSEANGLPNNIIYKILQDKAGLIWVSTDKGISSIDPRLMKIKNFSKPNGVQDSPFVLGSGMAASDGELFFGGQDGFNYFLPSALPQNNFMPPVLLTELKVANNTVVAGKNSPIDQQIGMAKDIWLNYGQNFSISYVALNFTAPQQSHYSYKLTGFDRDWNFVKKEKTAYYTNLDPGDYVFQVRASNNEGIWNAKTTNINVHVLPPIWRTIYAYFFYLLVVAGILFYARHAGIQKIKNQMVLEQEKFNAQQLIAQQRREADRMHELDMQKIKFLTNLSHEFRTPISLILAPADKLLLLPKDTAINAQVKMIRRNARRLLNLVNQLLDFRKMEEQELKLNLSSGDLVGFVKEAAESFQDLSDRKKISLIVECDLPELPADFDHDKIERIIFNLLSNAFKFTDEGGEIKLKMWTSEEIAKDRQILNIAISDTGIGIAPELKDKIFDRFFMENKVTSVLNQGSGIGLSITKEFVQLHGGQITVENKPDHGSTFYIMLPVIKPVNPLAVATPDKDKTDNQAIEEADYITDQIQQDKNKVTILLVEDNEEFRFHLKDSLQNFYHIIEAANGKEGWQKALSGHPQLIVSDISMPYMNGIELSQKIKADKRTNHIPVILLTAVSGEEDQIKGLESGATDYLTKPFNFEILNAKIKSILHYNRSLKDAYSKQIQVTVDEPKIESSDAKLLNTIVKHIDEKLNHPELSVEELSKYVGMSRGSLYHKLLELTGLTPIEFIRSVKLDRAAALLEKSDYNVAQIAYMTGFGTPSYFSRLFKSRYNVLPSEYITSKRQGNKAKVFEL